MTVLNNRELVGWIICIEEPGAGGGRERRKEIGGDKALERNAGLGMKVNPITSADVCGNVFPPLVFRILFSCLNIINLFRVILAFVI